MNEGLIARRYAMAMLKVAQKLDAAKDVYEQLKLFEQNYIAHPDLHKALLNPILSPRDKESLLTTAIGIENSELYTRGIRLLIANHREMYVRSICLMYQHLYRKKYNIGRVKIVSAAPLDKLTLERIKKMVADCELRELEYVEQIDPSLVGGFILQINSKQLDCSVSRELRELMRQLVQ